MHFFLDFLVLSLALSLSTRQILYAKYQLRRRAVASTLNLVWYKYRGLAPIGRVHSDTKCIEYLRRVALFGMRHLTYGINFLHLFAFLVSRPPQSTLLHCQAPTLFLNRWLACLTGSSILVLKLTFSLDPFPRNLSLSLTD